MEKRSKRIKNPERSFVNRINYLLAYGRIDEIINHIKKNIEYVNSKNEFGLSALMYSVLYGHIENVIDVIHCLFENGTDPNITDRLGRNALMLNIKHVKKSYNTNKIDLINTLINYGINLNLQENKGETALLLALKNNPINYKIITLLLNHGANTDLLNNDGKSVFDFADNNSLEIINKYKSFKIKQQILMKQINIDIISESNKFLYKYESLRFILLNIKWKNINFKDLTDNEKNYFHFYFDIDNSDVYAIKLKDILNYLE